MADDITVRFQAVGGAALAAEFEKVSAASVKTEKAVSGVDAATQKTGETFARTAPNAAKFYGDMSKALAIAGRFAVALNGIDGLLGQTGNSFIAAAGSIGAWGAAFGPAGAAAGGLIEAIKLLKSNLENVTAEFEKQTDDAVSRAIARANQRKLAAGIVTEEKGTISYAGSSGFNQKLEASGFGKYATKDTRPAGRATPQPNDDTAFETQQRSDAVTAQLEHLDKMDAQFAASREEREHAAWEAREELRQRELDEKFNSYNEDLEAWREAEEERNALAEAFAQQHAEREKLKKMVAIDALQSMASVGISALQKLAKGEKVSTKEILAALGDQLVARGTGHVLEGIAMSVMGLPSGPPLIAAGSAEVAFGIGLGAAGSGGAKSGGAAAGYQGSGGRGPASPNVSTRDRSYGDTRPIVVNYNMPTVTSPTEDDARRLQRVQDEGRRFGV